MYLTQVLKDLHQESSPPGSLHAEHLFKLNEAVFNLPEEEAVDSKMALKLFQAIDRIHIAYSGGRFDDTDGNFFYDYLALLGTMQNQHFFTQKQTEKLLGWIREAVGTSAVTPEPQASDVGKRAYERYPKYEDPGPRQAIGQAPARDGKGKAKGKGKGDFDMGGKGWGPASQPIGQARYQTGKGGKSKGRDDYWEEPAPPPLRDTKGKGKGKDAGKGKGKGRAVDLWEEEPEPPPLRGAKGKGKKGSKGPPPVEDVWEAPPPPKSKGKGAKGKAPPPEPAGKGKAAGKGKGKAPPVEEEAPPLRKGKGKGKGKREEEAPPPRRQPAPPPVAGQPRVWVAVDGKAGSKDKGGKAKGKGKGKK